MSTPPNAHLYDRDAIHASYVHRRLNTELTTLTESFYQMDNLASDEKGKSIVLASHSTFEKSGARCISVTFDKATAHIEYDNFSHGYAAPTQQVQNVVIGGLAPDEAVKAIVKEMAKIEPVFGSHIRAQEETAKQNQANLATKMTVLGRCGGPSSWS